MRGRRSPQQPNQQVSSTLNMLLMSAWDLALQYLQIHGAVGRMFFLRNNLSFANGEFSVFSGPV